VAEFPLSLSPSWSGGVFFPVIRALRDFGFPEARSRKYVYFLIRHLLCFGVSQTLSVRSWSSALCPARSPQSRSAARGLASPWHPALFPPAPSDLDRGQDEIYPGHFTWPWKSKSFCGSWRGSRSAVQRGRLAWLSWHKAMRASILSRNPSSFCSSITLVLSVLPSISPSAKPGSHKLTPDI